MAGLLAVVVAWGLLSRWPRLPLGIAGGFLVVWALLSTLRRRERKLLERWMDDKCVACGYDLRGIGRVGQCPECGTPFDGVDPTIKRESDETANGPGAVRDGDAFSPRGGGE
jgi:hypothetical protein